MTDKKASNDPVADSIADDNAILGLRGGNVRFLFSQIKTWIKSWILYFDAGSDPNAINIVLNSSTDPTSNRSAISTQGWQILQDTQANGTLDLGIYHYSFSNFSLTISTAGVWRLPQYGAGVLVTDATGIISATSAPRLTPMLVSALPAGAPAGSIAYCSDLRVFNGAGTQEGSGAGTGGMVTKNGSAWKIAGTNVTAIA